MDAGTLAQLRSYVGTSPSDAELEAAYVRLGSVVSVAREVLGTRLADLQSGPAKWSVDGDTAEDWSANLAALAKQVAGLEAIEQGGTLGLGVVSTVSLSRAERSR